MKKQYSIEKEGQIDFFENFHIDYENQSVLVENTDGIWNGNLLEFKLNITDLNKTLFQTIKYLSRLRIKGENVPANILLISLNTGVLYLYHSQDYFEDIHKIYVGNASKNNEGFIAKSYIQKYNYLEDINDTVAVKSLLNSNNFMPIEINEDCIVGWARRYYKENPTAQKGDFLGDDTGQIKIVGEIREPKHFQNLILPYVGKTNEKFKYLMDVLNDNLRKKDLGAFYTPIPYCKKAAELLRIAIEKVPKGNDYIILDRCAGTGNLESVLTEEELSHCILSTYEYYEYKILVERLGDKVLCIIPPTEAQVEYANGYVRNADALSKEFLENSFIKKYLDNPKVTVILYENPPFSEVAGNSEKESKENSWKNSYITQEMKKEISGVATNDSVSVFIWAAFKYYLRQPTDSYVVLGPIKYWKTLHLCDKKLEKSFILNRKYFHTSTKNAITCNLWFNEKENEKSYNSEVIDIENDKLVSVCNIQLKQVFHYLSEANDKRVFDNDRSVDWVLGKDGYLKNGVKITIKPILNDNIVGYMMHCGSLFERPDLQTQLTRLGYYGGHGYYLREDNYLEKLPLFCAGWFYHMSNIWYYNNIVARSLDKPNDYKIDIEFLKSCLIFTCLTNKNRCLSFIGPDNEVYLNKLCFENDTLATMELVKYNLNTEEEDLINLYRKILEEVKETEKYNALFKYGIYQIEKELNTFSKEKRGNKEQKVYDYPELNGDLNSLRTKLKEYYNKHIVPKMFQYELLK